MSDSKLHRFTAAVFAVLFFTSGSLIAQQKQRTTKTAVAGPAPTLTVAVDATDAPRHIFHSKVTIPAHQGTLTLYYPKWIPGEHAPTGPVVDTMGLYFRANGKDLLWRRDPLDMYTYNVEVPARVTSVEASFDYVSLAELGGFSAGSSATDQMAVLSWNWLVLYPKGWGSDQIQVKASAKIPQGWKWATPLPTTNPAGEAIDFAPASLTTVVDSPLMMGAHLKKVPLESKDGIAHELDIVSDSDAALQITDSQKKTFDNLVAESGALYGARHYRHYNFLLSLSNHVAHFGLEHHESNDSRVGENYLTDQSDWLRSASLLPHEFTHSWNGKYRRPYDLATPEYETPMQSDLLWVYEGLTEYLGYVLTGRSGFWTPEQWRDQMAIVAMTYTYRPGRDWRALEDTATAAQSLYGGGAAYQSYRRSVDYYDEGALIWLEADVTIRRLTNGAKSMDDFAHLFHGGQNTPPMVKTYNFDDVVNTLNQVAPYDWKKFLTDRVLRVAPQPPLGGIEESGWKIVYTDQPSAMMNIESSKSFNSIAGIGLIVRDDGTIVDSILTGPAYKAGLTPAMKIVAVNGRKYSRAGLEQALRDALKSKEPIRFIVENDEFFKTINVDYHDGLRYPHLVRDSSKPDVLSSIIKPKASTPPQATPEITMQ